VSTVTGLVGLRSDGPGWRLRIRHRTGFRYAGPVRTSYNEARLTPVTFVGQTTLDSRVEVTPAATTWRYWDYWGSQVTAFDVHEEHELLEVTGTSVVETSPARLSAATLSWGELLDVGIRERRVETLAPTPLTGVDDELAEAARGLLDPSDPVGTAVAVAGWVREQVAYVPGSTGVRTSGQEAWVQREGVCQDLAHLTAGLLRSLGLPARYVSGYLHPKPAAQVGESGEGQSHAWVEWWAGEWSGYDPTNGEPAGARHVVVARGRDYDDVPPLKGVYGGPPSTSLGVDVQIQRLA
jgi:transglutaminase-like putative cysteine protease